MLLFTEPNAQDELRDKKKQQQQLKEHTHWKNLLNESCDCAAKHCQ